MKPPTLALALLATLAGLYAAPAPAQVDLSGTWELQLQQDFRAILNSFPADFLGVPLNADARAAALAYSEESREELGLQCQPASLVQLLESPIGVRLWPDNGASGTVVAWHIATALVGSPSTTIWMDGRPAPSPHALHTFSGFSGGHWEGDTLVSLTTDLIESKLTPNGVPTSDRATVRLFITRYDDLLVISSVIRDPVYLAAPYVRAETFQLDPHGTTAKSAGQCVPAEVIAGISDGAHTVTLLPGSNPMLHYMSERYHIPLDAALGGPQTMYPQLQRQLASEYTPPTQYCKQDCCGALADSPFDLDATQTYDRKVLECRDGFDLFLN